MAHEYPTEKVKKLMDINVMGESATLIRLHQTPSLFHPSSSDPFWPSRLRETRLPFASPKVEPLDSPSPTPKVEPLLIRRDLVLRPRGRQAHAQRRCHHPHRQHERQRKCDGPITPRISVTVTFSVIAGALGRRESR